MIRQNRKIQFIILLTLACLVGSLTIAYAVLSTTLNITGTAQVQDATWNVHFDNIQVNPASVAISPKIVDNNKVTFSADLTKPGDFYKFTVDIVNDGTIDAMIDSIVKTPELTTEQKKYLRYEIEYTDGNTISSKQILASGETRTISVLFSFRTDIPVSDLPTSSTDFDLEILLVYYQADNTATAIPEGTNPIKIVSGDIETIGSEICIGKECFYLINNDGYNAVLLSKYNLHVGNKYDSTNGKVPLTNPTGIQDSTAKGWFSGYSIDNPIIGTTPFSSDYYWTSIVNEYPTYVYNTESYLYEYIENYKVYLESLGATINEGRLIKLEELENLGCSKDSSSCKNAQTWVYSTSYWSGTAHSSTNINNVRSNGDFGSNSCIGGNNGVRPVIEIPLTEF